MKTKAVCAQGFPHGTTTYNDPLHVCDGVASQHSVGLSRPSAPGKTCSCGSPRTTDHAGPCSPKVHGHAQGVGCGAMYIDGYAPPSTADTQATTPDAEFVYGQEEHSADHSYLSVQKDGAGRHLSQRSMIPLSQSRAAQDGRDRGLKRERS